MEGKKSYHVKALFFCQCLFSGIAHSPFIDKETEAQKKNKMVWHTVSDETEVLNPADFNSILLLMVLEGCWCQENIHKWLQKTKGACKKRNHSHCSSTGSQTSIPMGPRTSKPGPNTELLNAPLHHLYCWAVGFPSSRVASHYLAQVFLFLILHHCFTHMPSFCQTVCVSSLLGIKPRSLTC